MLAGLWHQLQIEGLFFPLWNLAFYVAVLPDILSSLLVFSEHMGFSLISALGDALSRRLWAAML